MARYENDSSMIIMPVRIINEKGRTNAAAFFDLLLIIPLLIHLLSKLFPGKLKDTNTREPAREVRGATHG